jgi:DNA polymerase elongation subunit (family B)
VSFFLIESCTGWLLDVYIEQDKAILWIKSEDKKILKLIDSSYQPFFYILPRNEYDGCCLFQTLSQQSMVRKVIWEENKFTDLFKEGSKSKLICIFPESVQYYNAFLKKLEKDARVKQFFNTDLSHIQQYLFHRLKIEPTSKVEVEYDDGSRLIKLTRVNECEISPPPFSLLYVNVYTLSGKINPEEPVICIKSRYEEDIRDPPQQTAEEILFNKGEEKNILEEFCSYVLVRDPDIIVNLGGGEGGGGDYSTTTTTTITILDYLFSRTLKLGLDLHLGREKTVVVPISLLKHPGVRWIEGRLSISNRRYHSSSALDKFGFAGLIEMCRFSFLTLDLAAKYSINRLIDSRNCYELIQRGFVVIAKNNNKNKGSSNNNHEHIRTIEELVSRDKGGMIISPQIGLHENVVVLDYDSEYANLIVNHNLSYETVLSKGGQTNKSQNKKGLLPIVVEKYLKRRLYFKSLLKRLPEDSKEYLWCQQRIDSLKNILVCLYGTTGSLWNRYGNVLVFEEINKLSREVLIKTKDIVQKLGYEVIYADTDSVFIKKETETITTPKEEYRKLVDILRKETALPISIEHNYKFLVLLPLEASEKIEVLKQYYGITYQGELVVRGIEARRRDIPKFIKQFQTKLLYTLFFDCKDVEDVINKGYENALLLVTKAIDKIMIGSSSGVGEEKEEEEGEDITQEDLVISKELGQDIEKYKSLFPHVCAAIQLGNKSSNNGNSKYPSKGDTIKYIYTDSQHKNPLCRVMPIEVSTQESSNEGGGRGEEEQRNEKEEQHDDDKKKNNHATIIYDKEKYREMILDAAETVLGYFGFDRTVYGNKRNKATRKWKWLLRDLKEEREKDIQIETMEK